MKKISKLSAEESIEILQQFIGFEGTELERTWERLIDLVVSYESYISKKLLKAVEAEIIIQATWAKDNLELVTKDEEIKHITKVTRVERK